MTRGRSKSLQRSTFVVSTTTALCGGAFGREQANEAFSFRGSHRLARLEREHQQAQEDTSATDGMTSDDMQIAAGGQMSNSNTKKRHARTASQTPPTSPSKQSTFLESESETKAPGCLGNMRLGCLGEDDSGAGTANGSARNQPQPAKLVPPEDTQDPDLSDFCKGSEVKYLRTKASGSDPFFVFGTTAKRETGKAPSDLAKEALDTVKTEQKIVSRGDSPCFAETAQNGKWVAAEPEDETIEKWTPSDQTAPLPWVQAGNPCHYEMWQAAEAEPEATGQWVSREGKCTEQSFQLVGEPDETGATCKELVCKPEEGESINIANAFGADEDPCKAEKGYFKYVKNDAAGHLTMDSFVWKPLVKNAANYKPAEGEVKSIPPKLRIPIVEKDGNNLGTTCFDETKEGAWEEVKEIFNNNEETLWRWVPEKERAALPWLEEGAECLYYDGANSTPWQTGECKKKLLHSECFQLECGPKAT